MTLVTHPQDKNDKTAVLVFLFFLINNKQQNKYHLFMCLQTFWNTQNNLSGKHLMTTVKFWGCPEVFFFPRLYLSAVYWYSKCIYINKKKNLAKSIDKFSISDDSHELRCVQFQMNVCLLRRVPQLGGWPLLLLRGCTWSLSFVFFGGNRQELLKFCLQLKSSTRLQLININ